MTNTKNNISPYAEEQTIQQKIKIPTNFIELKTVGKNYVCSTQGWPKEPICERYGFSANGKWIQLDITHQLMEKLDLELGKEIAHPIYISPEVLKQKPDEFSGITIDNEKDIICQKEGIILVQEKGTQIDFTSSEITDLKRKLKKSEELGEETQNLLEKIAKDNEEKHIAIIFFEQQIKDLTQRITELRHDLENEIIAKKREESKNQELERIIRNLRENEQILVNLQRNFDGLKIELGNKITTLTIERNRIQQNLTNLENKFKRIQGKFLGSLFISSKKSKEIKNLKIERVRLRAKMIEKDQQINTLTTQRDNLQTQVNNLNVKLGERDQTITNLNNEKSRLNSENNSLKNQLQSTRNEKSNYYSQIQDLNRQVSNWRDSYYKKDREIDNLDRQLSSERSDNGSLHSRINSLESELGELSPPKDVLLFTRAWFFGRDMELGVNTTNGDGVELKIQHGNSNYVGLGTFDESADYLLNDCYVPDNTCRGSKSDYTHKSISFSVGCRKFKVRCVGGSNALGEEVKMFKGWDY